MPFADRRDAGARLAQRLGHLAGTPAVVLGLPRGGVVVAAEVARALGAPLDVLVVRKLGHPSQPELGLGALGEGGVVVLNDSLLRQTGVTRERLVPVEARERGELERRLAAYRGGRAPVPLEGRTVVVVDDGIATGSTARAALEVVRRRGARRVVLAVPVAPPRTVDTMADVADEVVVVESPSAFAAIGEWYRDFAQTTDDEVVALLARLAGDLVVPADARGVVVFAHGSGSGRHSPRNQQVARALHHHGMGTLLFDLLTPEEAADRRNVFDVPLLASRLVDAVEWARAQPQARGLPVGLFGASTGGAAALWAAAEPGAGVGAVVSRGGRPDLARPRLADVRVPVLLVVGGADDVVLDLNRESAEVLDRCELAVVPGATYLFEEPGALETVSALAGEWFARHLGAVAA